MASAWVYQDDKQVKKHGGAKASWYVGWIDPAGKRKCKSCGPGLEGSRNAEKLRKKLEAELVTGTYMAGAKVTWGEFRKEYAARILGAAAVQTRRLTEEALDNFDRLVKPVKMSGIKTQSVDEFRQKRSSEPGKKKMTAVSPATVNKELRHLRAAFNVAVEWKYIPEAPRFRMVKEPKRLVRYFTAEHFAGVYAACDGARMPAEQSYPAGDWWRGLLVMGYMTGWRISELLSVRRDDVDLKAGTALTRAEDNKGGRDGLVRLHPVVVEHLTRLAGFGPLVFPWPHDRRTLDVEFHRLQCEAKINLPCRGSHGHTPACHVYGFHDLRRAFATVNAPRLTADALQKLMRHKSYLTTQRYINMASQLDDAIDVLSVPEVLRKKG